MYAENTEKAGEFAQAAIAGIILADVYIVFAYEDGTGVFSELAVAQLHGKLKIYAIAATIPPAMFHYHPLIRWVPNPETIFAELGV